MVPRDYRIWLNGARAVIGGRADMEPRDNLVYHSLYQQVEQFRRLRGDPAVKDFEELRKAAEAYKAEVIRNAPLEQRLAGVAPEEIARVLTPEQLAALTPEQLAALTPEQLAALTPEQRFGGLPPEQLAELLAQLPPELLLAISRKRSS